MDRPSEADNTRAEFSASRHYYYGIGRDVDYQKARYGAFLEIEGEPTSLFADKVILMMLYANGFGVARDTDIATRLACETGGADDEVAGRVERLRKLSDDAHAQPFDFCDDATSGLLMGACATLALERERAALNAATEAIVTQWPLDQRLAFDRLRLQANASWKVRVERELDLSAPDREAVVATELRTLERGFASAIERFAREPNAGDSPEGYARADADLNRVYKEALAKDFTYSTVDPAGIRATEKTWIAYRDAWVALGAVRYPNINSEAWKTWLTLERTRQLQEVGD